MIHNGRVSEADFLKKKYQIRSDTDSEVLLRMYEHGVEHESEIDLDVEPDVSMRLKGLRDIWSLVQEGAMAVAFGELFDAHTRHLYLFRNKHRPLWIADVRDTLGQIFFFSSPEIWYRAVASSPMLKNACESMNCLLEVPVGQVWFFKIDKDNQFVGYGEDSYCKFDIEVLNKSKAWEEGEKCEIKEPVMDLQVISQLDQEDRIVYSNSKHNSNGERQPHKVQKSQQRYDDPYSHWHDDGDYRGDEHDDIVTEIETALSDLSANLSNYFMEGSLKPGEYEESLESLGTMDENDLDIENILEEKTVKKKVNAKKKGNRVELALCKLLTKQFGKEFSRSVGSGNRWSQVHHMPEHAKKTLVGDICAPENFLWVIECKGGYEKEIDLNGIFTGNSRLDSFIEQSENDEGQSGRQPIICWKQSRKPWLAMVKDQHLVDHEFEVLLRYKNWNMVLLEELIEHTDEKYWFRDE
ncbi:unnamed protein product [Symbiodinium microadriaticum]|nr:unnamed protein product [Symbiodinium microadriaticum]